MQQADEVDVTDEELIAKWEAILSGTGCGCPLCTRDLLDDIATRFREVVGPQTARASDGLIEVL